MLDENDMAMNGRSKGALLAGAAALGVVALARTWRQRERLDFSGKVVLITGGSRGLGLVMARRLVEEGARLVLVARDEAELARAADDLHARQPFADVMTIAGDVRVQTEAERIVAAATTRFGGIDVLINNAGIIATGPLDHMKVADYEDAMNTHFWAPLFMTRAVLPSLRTRGGGRIVNISSIGGRVAVPHMVPYSASKFALVGLSDGLRAELAHENIFVTTVCPGLMRTGSPVNAMFKGQHPREYAWFAISNALPIASIDAERAARQIVDACRRGDAELVITIQAKAAILLRTLAPELFADAMVLMNRLLPEPSPYPDGNRARPGRESESAWAPSVLTTLNEQAARENNERS